MRIDQLDREILKKRINSNVSIDPETECWLWKLSKRHAYGRIKFRGKMYGTHRVAFAVFKGDFDDAHDVLHSCDVGHCLNPDHLFLGTAKDNVQDMIIKGRRHSMKGIKFGKRKFKYGDRNPNAKLTWEQVRQIVDTKGTIKSIASAFGVRHAAIRRIKNGQTWIYATGLKSAQ